MMKKGDCWKQVNSRKKLSSLQFTPPNPACTCCYRKRTETQTKGLAVNWFHWNVVMNANGAEANVPSPRANLAFQCSTFSLNDEEAGVSGLAFITVRGAHALTVVFSLVIHGWLVIPTFLFLSFPDWCWSHRLGPWYMLLEVFSHTGQCLRQ